MTDRSQWTPFERMLASARGDGCPKCLVGRRDLMADPMFACDVCQGTGIEHFALFSAAPDLLAALKMTESLDRAIDSFAGNEDIRNAVRAAIAKAEGR